MTKVKGFKFVTTLVLVFIKIESKDKIKYDNFYSHSKAETIMNESDIDYVFESIFTTIITKTQQAELFIQPLIILLVFQSIIL